MKLALVSCSPYPPIGGAGARLVRLFEPISKRHEIHIFNIGPHVRENKDFVDAFFQVHQMKLPFAKISILRPEVKWILTTSCSMGPLLPQMIKRHFLKRLKNGKFDAVFSYDAGFSAPIALSISKECFLPLFSDYPDLELYSSNFLYVRVMTNMLKTVFKESRHLFSISDFLKSRLIDFYGIPENKITVVPNGVDTKMFSPAIDGSKIREKFRLSDSFVIGYCGALEKWTRVDILLKAFKKLRRVHNVKLLIVGFGSELDRWKMLSERLGIKKDVVFTGLVAHKEVPAYLASFDIAVSIFSKSSLAEAVFPLKVLEYMSMKKAIVADDLPGTRELVENMRNGILFEPENPDSLVVAIDKIIENSELKNRLEKEARKKALAYDWKKLSKKIEKKIAAELRG
ncbi:MAG: glycosyltransferase family 4 protein [Candidatus Hadarchaeum sp.]|uniref:glycosyltransferase family 4 protein n=1 Tax=Candidatus Hadarchaeum sp. TaxID=2883567 RepID=UPI00316F81F1